MTKYSPSVITSGPSTIPNLAIWYAADQGAYEDTAGTDPAEPGDGVAFLTDLSGNGYNITQNTGANRPIYTGNVQNSLPVLRFTAASSHYLFSSSALYQFNGQFTAFAVTSQNWDDATNFRTIICSGDYAGGAGVNFSFSGIADDYAAKSAILSFGGNNGVTKASATYGFTGSSGFHIVDINCGSRDQVYADGTLRTGSALARVGTGSWLSGIYLGKSGASFNSFMNGDIAEVIVYDRTLSSSERSTVRRYLSQKWAIPVSS